MTRAGHFALAIALLAACDPRIYNAKAHEDEAASDDDDDEDDDSSDGDDDDDRPSNPFGPMALFGGLGKREPGAFEEPKSSPDAKKAASYSPVLRLAGGIVELEAGFDLFGGPGGTELRTITTRLRELERDPKVATVLLRVGELDGSYAAAEELYATLSTLEKPVECHVEDVDTLTYLVVSACDRITMASGGTVAVLGPALTPVYLKGLLDLLGMEADFLHVGAYKGAAEPLTRTEPSPELKQTFDDLLDGMYASLVERVALGRKKDAAAVKAWIDGGPRIDEAAVAAGLVDNIQSYEEWRDAHGAWRKLDWKEEEEGVEGLFAKLGLQPKPRVTKPHIALVYAVGPIVSGRGDGLTGARGQVASERLVPAIRAAAADDNVKAILLRVDSPGGSALASEQIFRAVEAASKRKPVVVSMAGVAASGGYYISCGALRIFAEPDTLTGSIGVVGGKLVLTGTLHKLGVRAYELPRGAFAATYSPFHRFSDAERAMVQAQMDEIYAMFKRRVAAGRSLPEEEVEASAQGRVWTGAEAQKRKLVDELGGLDAAIAWTARQAGLPADAPLDVYPSEPTLIELLQELTGGEVRAPSWRATLAALPVAAAVDVRTLRVAGQVLDLVGTFQREPVQAVLVLPLL